MSYAILLDIQLNKDLIDSSSLEGLEYAVVPCVVD